jgi:hypothetical protein
LQCHDGCKNIFIIKREPGMAEGPFRDLVGIKEVTFSEGVLRSKVFCSVMMGVKIFLWPKGAWPG